MSTFRIDFLAIIKDVMHYNRLTLEQATELQRHLTMVGPMGWTFTQDELRLSVPGDLGSPSAVRQRESSSDDEEEPPAARQRTHTPHPVVSYVDTAPQKVDKNMTPNHNFFELNDQVEYYLGNKRQAILNLSHDGKNERPSPCRAMQCALWFLDADQQTIDAIGNAPYQVNELYDYESDHFQEDVPIHQGIQDNLVPAGYKLHKPTKTFTISALINPETDRNAAFYSKKRNGIPLVSYPFILEVAAKQNTGGPNWKSTYVVFHTATRVFIPCDNRNHLDTTPRGARDRRPQYWYNIGTTIRDWALNRQEGYCDKALMARKVGPKIFPVKGDTTVEPNMNLKVLTSYYLVPSSTSNQN